MDRPNLLRLLRDLESDRVERKRSLTSDVRRAVCAFANDLPDHKQPGVVFIGAEDDGACAGATIDDELLKRLAEMRSDGKLQPFPQITVQKHTLDGCVLAVVEIAPAEAPPVRLDGRVYVRVGPTTRQASPQEELTLSEKRRSGDLPFDLRALPSANLEDLDLDLFRRTYLPAAVSQEVLERNQRSSEDQLASLRMADPSTNHPTVLGILVLGKDPRRFVPGFYVQFLRIDGDTLADPIKDQKEIDGPLSELLSTLDEVLKAHITVNADLISGDQERRHPDYPLVALQQLIRNAVLHRTYEGTHAPVRVTWFADRIEIQSSGGPYGQVTRARFGQPGVTDYRNPHLAEAMKNLGYVQRFGIGIAMARHELNANGNPPPEFETDDGHVLVVLRKRP